MLRTGRLPHRTAGAFVPGYVSAALDGDEPAAMAVVAEALLSGATRIDVYSELIAPALRIVGRMWELCELSVADEHMVSMITGSVLARVAPPPAGSPTRFAVVACVEGEHHHLGAQSAAGALSEAGWGVVYLGPSTPTAALEGFLARRRPDLVALAVKGHWNRPAAMEAIARVRACSPPTAVLVGGDAAGPHLGADHGGDSLPEALAWLEERFG